MGDDLARVAIYALRRPVLEMPEGRALPLLRRVPMECVTVAKEVVRLIGELHSDDAYDYLLVLEGQELHRDVRVALLRALWDYLEREETWPILDLAARSSDPAIARGVIRIPADRLSSEAQRRLAFLLATLLEHPEPRVRTEVLQRLSTLPITDVERALLPRLMEALASSLPDECRDAAGAVFATYAGRDAELVGRTVARIRDDRRVLRTVVTALKGQLSHNRGQLLATTRSVISALEPDPLTVSLRIELAVDVLPWDEMAGMFTRLAESGELHCEALTTGVREITDVTRQRHWGLASRTDAREVGVLESALAGSQDERLRRIALAVLVAVGNSPTGWTEDRLDRLRAYRADPSPLVASAAQFTLPTEEQG